jgi:serine protease Do
MKNFFVILLFLFFTTGVIVKVEGVEYTDFDVGIDEQALVSGGEDSKENKDITGILGEVLKKVVTIEIVNTGNVSVKGDDDERLLLNELNNISGIGSGFIISEDGYIITNSHVVSDANKIFVNHADERYQAELIGDDLFQDVALLKINTNKKLPFVEMKPNLKVKMGEKVIVVGNPYNLGASVSTGIVSAINRSIKGTEYRNLIQTDAAINRGNSGGPMFNLNGDVIGITSLIFSPNNSGENIGIGFAIPISDVVDTIRFLRENGYIKRGWLGISGIEVDGEFLKILNSKRENGIFVKDVVAGSPADIVGIVPSDVIVSYNNKHIKDLSQLLYMIRNSSVGSSVDILVLRNEKHIKFKPTIKELPNGIRYNGVYEKIKSNSIEIMDMFISQIDKNLIDEYKLYHDLKGKGMYVLDIRSGGWAEKNKIEKGDIILSINQNSVDSKNSFINAINVLKNNKQKEFIMVVKKRVTGENIILRLNFNIVNY